MAANDLEPMRSTHGRERKYLREAMRNSWRNPPHRARSILAQLQRTPAQRQRTKDLRRQRFSKYAIPDDDDASTDDSSHHSDCESYDTDTWELVGQADAVSIGVAELLNGMPSVSADFKAAINRAVAEVAYSFMLGRLL